VSRLNKWPERPLLCYVTDRRALSDEVSADPKEALLRDIEIVAAAGIAWIQIREKDLSGKECAALTREALQRTAKFARNVPAARILLNDRLDIALAEHCAGVHLGENSLPVEDARHLATSRASTTDFLYGVSCHSLHAAKSAAADGADYIFFGPIFATPSKAAFGEPQGLARLSEICAAVNIPVLAIGGITLANAAACFATGAAGIAAIRLFQETVDTPSLVKSLRQAWHGAAGFTSE